MRFLSHNWHIKLLCMVGAIMLAAFVRKQENVLQRTIVLPVNITPPVGQRMTDPPRGANVEVELEGPSDAVRAIQDTDIRLVVDTSAVGSGKRIQVPVLVELPDKFHRVMVNWRPRSIGVRFVSDTAKQFPVHVKVLNRLDDWETETPRADVEQVNVSGSEDAVNRVVRVTAPLTLEPLESMNVLSTLQALAIKDDKFIDITDQVHITPPQVMVNVSQQRVLLAKRLDVQADWQIPPDARIAEVEIVPRNVLVTGPRRLMRDLDLLDTMTITVPPGKTVHTQSVDLVIPDSRLQVNPQRVRVTIRLKPPAAGTGTEPPRPRPSSPEPPRPRGNGTDTPPSRGAIEPVPPRTGGAETPTGNQ